MNVLQIGPNIKDDQRVGGIKTVVLVISKLFPHFKYFSRSGIKGKSLIPALKDFFSILNEFRNYLDQNDFDLVHLHSALETTAIIRDILFVKIARKRGIPVLLHMHDGRFFIKRPTGILKKLSTTLLNSADQIIVLGEKEKSFLVDVFGITTGQVLQNCLNVDEIPEARPKFEKASPALVFLGRVDLIKGHEEILIALTKLKKQGYEFKYNLYGSGPLLESLQPRCEEALGESFEYKGVVNGDAKWEALNNSDIFLLPSRFEGLPMALLEAMSLELVCITSPVGCISEVVHHGENGIITSPGNAAELEQNIREVLDNPEVFQTMRKNARNDIFTRYNEKTYKQNLENIYGRVPVK